MSDKWALVGNGYNTFCKLGNLMDDIYGFCSDAERRTDAID